MTMTRYRTTMEVVEITGATYRQLDYWCRTGRIPDPDRTLDRLGSGGRRRWTAEQIVRAMLLVRASRLVNATLDEAVELLREEEQDAV